MTPRKRRLLRVVRLRAIRFARRQYVTMISAAVLAVAAALAFSSTGFERPAPVEEASAEAEVAAVVATSSPPVSPTPQRVRRLAVVYFVTDERQGGTLLISHNSLVRDAFQLGGDLRHFPQVSYLVAGTWEAEAIAIQRLNVLFERADQQQFDVQVIDLRAGRSPAANIGTP